MIEAPLEHGMPSPRAKRATNQRRRHFAEITRQRYPETPIDDLVDQPLLHQQAEEPVSPAQQEA